MPPQTNPEILLPFVPSINCVKQQKMEEEKIKKILKSKNWAKYSIFLCRLYSLVSLLNCLYIML